jgi:hypothetical protein
MTDPIVFKSIPVGKRWKVTRNDHFVSNYPNQSIAEKAVARHARAEANKGNRAIAILHKRDGTPYAERSYTRLTTPWSRAKAGSPSV